MTGRAKELAAFEAMQRALVIDRDVLKRVKATVEKLVPRMDDLECRHRECERKFKALTGDENIDTTHNRDHRRGDNPGLSGDEPRYA